MNYCNNRLLKLKQKCNSGTREVDKKNSSRQNVRLTPNERRHLEKEKLVAQSASQAELKSVSTEIQKLEARLVEVETNLAQLQRDGPESGKN